MNRKTLAAISVAALTGTLMLSELSQAAASSDRLVRLAELEIDPASLNVYRAALREEIETSIRMEPGVLALYSVSIKDHPNQIRLFEMYASDTAYQAHLQSTHFKKYKQLTAGMIKSLRLIETEPLLLGAK
jgi:quinol monooxygenase YgiN